MTRRSLLSALIALVLPKPATPDRYLFFLRSVEVPDDLWTRPIVYKIKNANFSGWEFRNLSWTLR